MNGRNLLSDRILRAIVFLVVANLSNVRNQCSKNATTSIPQHIDLLQLSEAKYIWSVDRLYFGAKGKNFSIESPTFSAPADDEFKWYLRLEPNWAYFFSALFLHLSPDSKRPNAWIQLDFDLLNDEQGETSLWHWRISEPMKEININTTGWGTTDIPKNNEYFSKNKMIILCKVRYCADIPILAHPRDTQTTTSLPSSTPDDAKFWDNLASLFNNSKFTDILLMVNGTQYPAHKTILAARSPVFAAKFERSAKKGKQLKRMNITNMNQRVAGEMLRYIYTGKCENLLNIADQLLVAADKYGLNELKTICAQTLYKNLTVGNAAKTLLLAEKQGIADLKAKAIAFISAKYSEISNTTNWRRIAKRNPEFVHDIYHHAVLHDVKP